jgi:hypothetical protein
MRVLNMASVKEEIELKERCLTDTITKLARVLNSKQKYGISFNGIIYGDNDSLTKMVIIGQAADLIREYSNQIATLRTVDD